MGDPAPHIIPLLRSTECCVAEGLCSPLDGRGVERGSAEGVVMDVGLTALAIQCKTCLLFLRGTRCRVAEESCLSLVVREVDHCVQAEL